MTIKEILILIYWEKTELWSLSCLKNFNSINFERDVGHQKQKNKKKKEENGILTTFKTLSYFYQVEYVLLEMQF